MQILMCFKNLVVTISGAFILKMKTSGCLNKLFTKALLYFIGELKDSFQYQFCHYTLKKDKAQVHMNMI